MYCHPDFEWNAAAEKMIGQKIKVKKTSVLFFTKLFYFIKFGTLN